MGQVKLGKIISDLMSCEELDESKYFTQFNICKDLRLHNKGIKESDIQTTIVNLEIDSTKIINTVHGVSLEGQNLTGKKLVIIGNLKTKVIICCDRSRKKLYSLEKNIPFSTFIIVPGDICEEEPINLRYIIEDATTTVISENKCFVSITLLIQYIDEY